MSLLAADGPRGRRARALARRGQRLMLSIGKLAAGQAGYYERQVARGRDDYYSGRGEAPGEWAGRGAAALGLVGQVEAAQFNALMAGLDPSDEALERRLRDSRGEPKVVGFDLTFSAPKSVSVLFAVGDEQTAGQLVAAHESAVRAALEYVEDAAVKVRRGKGGMIVEPGEGVIAAAYRVEHDVAAEIPGLGPEPPDQRVRGAWRQAGTVVAEVQKRLGRSVDRGAGLEL